MTIQLNPTTSDSYETKTIAQLRQMVYNGLGFLDLLTATKTETLGAIRADIYNMLGYAAMPVPLGGVNALLNSYINEAQQALYRTIEFGTGAGTAPPILVNDTDVTVLDGTAVRQLALGMAKAHYSQDDAQIYLGQNEKYLKDLVARNPPSAKNLITQLIKSAQMMLYRRYDVFRMERWFTWTFVAGQRFYSISGNDERAPLPTPTGVTVTQGDTGTYGSMAFARTLASATLLSNGKMLVAGGYANGGLDDATAELYDPATGLFSTTGSLNQARQAAFAVPLPGGLVLIAGGSNGATLNTTETYNPQTGTFTPSSNMIDGRTSTSGCAVVLKNNKVLFFGGHRDGSPLTVLATAELYDPSTGTFSATSDLTTALTGCASVVLSNGKVLTAGGIHTGSITTPNSLLYDPVAGTWSATGSLNTDRTSAQAVLLANGKALVAGGTRSGFGTIASSEIYDPVAGTWSPTGDMVASREDFTLTLLPNGKVLAVGGTSGVTLSSAELYDPVAGTWATVAGGISTPRALHTAILSPYTLNVYIAGGSDGSFAPQASMDVYNTLTNTFSTSGIFTSGNYAYRVAAVDNNGKSTLASLEVTILAVPAQTAVIIQWSPLTQANVSSYLVYGRTAGLEQLLAQVPASVTTWTDYGTLKPNGALPTSNTTGNIGPVLDQRQASWVGISNGDVGWRPLRKGVPPITYSNQLNGIPIFYDIREQIEVWPPPVGPLWALHIKGYFTCGPFEADTDTTTIDWQAVYLQALADAKIAFKQPDAQLAEAQLRTYIGDLIAGTHGTARYIPGPQTIPNAIRPVLLDSNGNPVT